MSGPALLVAKLELRGVRLSADGETLRYDAPASTADGLEATLAENKPALLGLLWARRPSAGRACGCGRRIVRGGLMCGACRARELGWSESPAHESPVDGNFRPAVRPC